MSSIPISSIVEVNVLLQRAYPERRGFGTLLLVTNEQTILNQIERVRYYENIESVANDWLADSEVYKAATTYFSQQPKPKDFKVAIRFENDTKSMLRGGSVDDVSLFTSIADGSFKIIIDDVEQELVNLDFTSDATMEEVSQTINLVLNDAEINYYQNRFTVTTNSTGETSKISFVTNSDTGTDISELLQLTQNEAKKTNGFSGETCSQALNNIEKFDNNFFGVSFTKEVRDDVVINGESAVESIAAWCEARSNIYFTVTNDYDSLDVVSTSDIAFKLSGKYKKTIITYSSKTKEYLDLAVAGRALTVDLNTPDSAITMKFKELLNVSVEDLSSYQKNVLDSKNCNCYIEVGGLNIFTESIMTAGGNNFFDRIYGIEWLKDAFQKELYGFLATRTTKLSYTNKDVLKLVQKVTQVCEEAVRNNLIAEGETDEGLYLARGYKVDYMRVENISKTIKDTRYYNGLTAILLGAGALHGLQFNFTFE